MDPVTNQLRAAQYRTAALRLYSESSSYGLAIKPVRGLVYLLWAGLLATLGLSGIVPVWVALLSALFGFPVMDRVVTEPMRDMFRRAEEYDREADVLEAASSVSTSASMGVRRN